MDIILNYDNKFVLEKPIGATPDGSGHQELGISILV